MVRVARVARMAVVSGDGRRWSGSSVEKLVVLCVCILIVVFAAGCLCSPPFSLSLSLSFSCQRESNGDEVGFSIDLERRIGSEFLTWFARRTRRCQKTKQIFPSFKTNLPLFFDFDWPTIFYSSIHRKRKTLTSFYWDCGRICLLCGFFVRINVPATEIRIN